MFWVPCLLILSKLKQFVSRTNNINDQIEAHLKEFLTKSFNREKSNAPNNSYLGIVSYFSGATLDFDGNNLTDYFPDL